MEDTNTKDSLPVHLILGASDHAKIKTETASRIGALGEPIGEKTKLGWTIMSPGKEVDLSTMFFTQTSARRVGIGKVISGRPERSLCRI